MSGPEGSSIKRLSGCAAGPPGSSHLAEKRLWKVLSRGGCAVFTEKKPRSGLFAFLERGDITKDRHR